MTTTRRGRAVGLAALLALLVCSFLLLTTSAHPGTPSASEARAPIDGYPQRIGFDRPSPRLPERPGPLAATMYDNDFGNRRVLGVTARGDLWELPQGTNVLSPDGTRLLTEQWEGQDGERQSRLAVRDLSSGEQRVFDDITAATHLGARRGVTRFVLDHNGAVRWSPDGSMVLTELREKGRRGSARVQALDVSSGEVTEVGVGDTAGFLGPSVAVTVAKLGGRAAERGILVTTTDLSTGETGSRSLELAGPWRGDADAGLVASISPDGTTLLLVEAAGGGRLPDATLRLFSLPDGEELAPRTISQWDGCPPTWSGDDPVLPTGTRGFRGSLAAGNELVTAEESRPLVAVHHRLQSSCLQLTPAALDAGPHRALLGTSTSLWTWYWWQLLLGGALVLSGLGLLLARRRRHSWSQAANASKE